MSTMPMEIAPLAVDGARIVPEIADGELRVAASGELAMRDPDRTLDPYWEAAHREAERQKIARVVLDVRRVDFMNSSAILTLVRWINKVKASVHPYRLVFLYDRNVTWQKNSLPTLAKLAPGHVEAQAEG